MNTCMFEIKFAWYVLNIKTFKTSPWMSSFGKTDWYSAYFFGEGN